MDNSGHLDSNRYSGNEEGRSPFSRPNSVGLTNTLSTSATTPTRTTPTADLSLSSVRQRLNTPHRSPHMYEGQQMMLTTDMMYEQNVHQQNFGPLMIDNSSMPDSQTNRNVILNQAESSLPSEVSSPVSMPSNMVSMSDHYSGLRSPAVTRVTTAYNGSDSHEVTAVSTALAPDSNNLERVSQSPYQHTGHQVMQTLPDKGTHVISTNASRKPAARTSKKKKKKDPHEPQKPVSAYALFFRDTQASIKVKNPNASFGEVSKLVASMWDGLNQDTKNKYKKQTEAAKKEYLKLLADYKASLVSRGTNKRDPNYAGEEYGHYQMDDQRRNNSRPTPGMTENMFNMQQHRLPSPVAKGKTPIYSPMLTPDGPNVGHPGQRNDVNLPVHSPLQYGGGMHHGNGGHGNGDQRRMGEQMRCSYGGQMGEVGSHQQLNQQHHYIHENPGGGNLNTSTAMYTSQSPISVQSMTGGPRPHIIYGHGHGQQMIVTSMHNQTHEQYPQSPYEEYIQQNDMMNQQLPSIAPTNGSTSLINGDSTEVTYMMPGHGQNMSSDMLMRSPRVNDGRSYHTNNGSPLSYQQQTYTQMYEAPNQNENYRMSFSGIESEYQDANVGQMNVKQTWTMVDQGRTIADLDSRKVSHERSELDRYSFTYSSPSTDSSASLTCTKSDDDKVEPTSSISRFFEGFSPSMCTQQNPTWVGDHISTPNS